MIVPLADVKRMLGIAALDVSSDADLTRLIGSATSQIERYTKRRFDVPISHTEYHFGMDSECIILDGHIDDSPEADNPSETRDPTTSLVIDSRPVPRIVPATWDPMVESIDWERRGDEIYGLGGWGLWQSFIEYRFSYLDGYAVAPADIQEVLMELVVNRRIIELRASDGSAGITAERLGDFSYSVDLTQVGAGGKSGLSESSRGILNRYRRLLV